MAGGSQSVVARARWETTSNQVQVAVPWLLLARPPPSSKEGTVNLVPLCEKKIVGKHISGTIANLNRLKIAAKLDKAVAMRKDDEVKQMVIALVAIGRNSSGTEEHASTGLHLRSGSFLQQKLDKLLDSRGMLFKLLNGVFRAKTFYIKVVLKYQINPFFKFVIIKTQLIIYYYHLVLRETLNIHLHLQKIQTPSK
uniref:Uncharacterized protein n=1 Tax=Oryza rufipogon TaxID=4529 RepID=A0A0E0ND08_ORYRU